jgi:hypothetical protein
MLRNNHHLRDVGPTVVVSDAVDASVDVTVRVLCDERDCEKDAALREARLLLRGERNPKRDGRVYLVLATATDDAGNSTTARAAVVVPKSRSPLNIASVVAQAAAALASSAGAADGVPPGYVTVLPTTSFPGEKPVKKTKRGSRT